MSEREPILELSPEDISRIARVMAETIAREPETFTRAFAAGSFEYSGEGISTRVSYAAVLTETEFIQHIRLDLVASSLHGLTDPLGQLQSWLSSVFDSVKNWIVSQIKGALE